MKKVLLTISFCWLAVVSSIAIETNYRTSLIFAYSQANGVFEDDNIKLEIYDEKLWVTNKTKRTLYIDYSQCFLVHNGSSYPMFSKKQDERHASKLGKATSIDEFLTVAPSNGVINESFVCNMSTRIFGDYTTTETPSGDFTDYDKRFLSVIEELTSDLLKDNPSGKYFKGTASKHLTEDETVNSIGVSIAYAFNKRSEEWTNVQLTTWVSDIIIAPYYVVFPNDLSKDSKKGFGVKETLPAEIHFKADSPFEFEEDKSPLIVCDWKGNFDKGKFRLSNMHIAKQKHVSKGVKTAMAIYSWGLTKLLEDALIEKECYKNILVFDHNDADWGEMKFVNSLEKTSQSK